MTLGKPPTTKVQTFFHRNSKIKIGHFLSVEIFVPRFELTKSSAKQLVVEY